MRSKGHLLRSAVIATAVWIAACDDDGLQRPVNLPAQADAAPGAGLDAAPGAGLDAAPDREDGAKPVDADARATESHAEASTMDAADDTTWSPGPALACTLGANVRLAGPQLPWQLEGCRRARRGAKRRLFPHRASARLRAWFKYDLRKRCNLGAGRPRHPNALAQIVLLVEG
jgi:hypothetical protein